MKHLRFFAAFLRDPGAIGPFIAVVLFFAIEAYRRARGTVAE